MRFGALASFCGCVNFTVYVWRAGKFRQWYPKKFTAEMRNLDQSGSQLIKNAPELMQMQIHSIIPTAYNHMSVYLFSGGR